MIAVPNFPHLYLRNNRYYLRLTIDKKQVWISLKTDSIDKAVFVRSRVKSIVGNINVFDSVNAIPKITQLIKVTLKACANEQIHLELGSFEHRFAMNSVEETKKQKVSKFSEVAKNSMKRSTATSKGLADYERSLAIWLALTDDLPIDRYIIGDIGSFIDKCFNLPRSNKRPYNQMSWKQRVKCKVPQADKVSRKSVFEIYKWVKSVFAYACDEEVGILKKNPCTIKRDFKQETRGNFNDQELMKIRDGVLNIDKPWKKWITLIVMYHGMRRGEICQLRKEDIQIDSQTSRPYFFIRALNKDQTVKTAASIRKVPIHQFLIDLGFMERVNSSNGRVFKELKSQSVTGWFARFMLQNQILNIDDFGNTRSFHSFRHSFISKLRNTYPNLFHIQQLVGHRMQNGKTTDSYSHFIDSLGHLVKAVDSFSLECPL